jgi:cobalt-precorrin 5A hydrolase
MNNQITQRYRPGKFLWVGIGCQRGTSLHLLATAIQQVCREYLLDASAIAGIATIDTKVSEVGLVELCRLHHWPLKTFGATILRTVPVPNPAKVIAMEVGTPSVAEAAAILAAAGIEAWEGGGEDDFGVMLLVPKQILGSVTVAIAQINQLL